jgi:hypothetical protein
MRIATYNVNGINGRLGKLLGWLDETRPDIVCLQELKAPDEKFPAPALRAAGYGAVWHGQKSWNGVAILARGADPVETCGLRRRARPSGMARQLPPPRHRRPGRWFRADRLRLRPCRSAMGVPLSGSEPIPAARSAFQPRSAGSLALSQRKNASLSMSKRGWPASNVGTKTPDPFRSPRAFPRYFERP